MKYCKKCDAAHPLSAFNKDKSRKDGLQPYCRNYTRSHSAKWRADNPDYNRTYLEGWRERNPNAFREWASTPQGRESQRLVSGRRRARKRQLPTEPYSRCTLALRDNGTSWVSGDPVDAADAQGVHVDHLIPLAYYIPGHPGDVVTNVALCEAGPNMGRHDQLTSAALQRYTRNLVLDVPDVSGLGDVLGAAEEEL